MRNNLNGEFVHHNQCHTFVAIETVPGYECQCIGGNSVLFRERSEAGVTNQVILYTNLANQEKMKTYKIV